MSFRSSNWGVISSSGNTQAITLQNGLVIGAPSIYTYQSATETIATISSPDYFASIGATVAVGDLIYIVASDASNLYEILQVDATLGTLIIAQFGGGTGNVTGPGSSTNTAVARWNGASGELLSDSTVLLDNSGNLTGVASETVISGGSVNFNNAGNTFATSIKGGNAGANTTYTLPTAYPGSNGEVLASTTGGVLSWSPAGTGNVVGPGSSTNTALARWNGITGQLLEDSTVLLDNSGNLTNIASATIQSAGAVNFNNAGNTFATSIIGGNAGANVTYTLPISAPSANNSFLTSTTAGTMAWAIATGGVTADRIVYVDAGGSDVTGDGSVLFPYATIFKANSVISGNANATRWIVSIGAGKFIETQNILLKPYVSYVGRGFGGSYIQSPNNIIGPDPSVGTATARIGLYGLYIGGTTSIVFNLPSLGGSFSCVLELIDTNMNAGVTFVGRTLGADFFQYLSGYAIGSIALSNCQGFLLGVAVSGNFTLDTAGSSGASNFNFTASAASNYTIASTGGISNTITTATSLITGTVAVSGATTTASFDAVSLPTLASNFTVSGGATVNYLTSAWGINAAYTPVHYTAVSTDVTGNLHGIDNALGAISASFVNQTTGSATLAANTTYLTNNGASLVTYTLPATATVGDSYTILGFSSGGWTLAQGAGQSVQFGNATTTVGAGGSLSSSNKGDCVTLRCAVANTTWIAYNSQGNITYV